MGHALVEHSRYQRRTENMALRLGMADEVVLVPTADNCTLKTHKGAVNAGLTPVTLEGNPLDVND